MDESKGQSGFSMFLRRDVTVFEQIAKFPSGKEAIAQQTKDKNIQSVFPLLTAPSQIMASRLRFLEEGHHQERTSSCFGEKYLKVILLSPTLAFRRFFPELQIIRRRFFLRRRQGF